jgi:hypothetical protein
MAIRQTLLTTFIIPSPLTSTDLKSQPIGESDDIVTRITNGGPIIVDLSDPILRSTGLDSTLFDMILCLYCVVNPDSRKLLGKTSPYVKASSWSCVLTQSRSSRRS